MTDPDLTTRQEALADWLREHLVGYLPTPQIHATCELYGPGDLDGLVEDLQVLAGAGVIGDAPGSDGPLGHRWRAAEHIPMMVTVRVPVTSADEDWDAVVETLRDIIDIPTADIVHNSWEVRIAVPASGGGMFGALQAAHEILAVLYDAVRTDCARVDDAKLMAVRAFLEQAHDATVEARGT